MLRLINLAVIGALVVAASWLYEIKYSSTRAAERTAAEPIATSAAHLLPRVAALADVVKGR